MGTYFLFRMTEGFFLHWTSFLIQWLFHRKNQNWSYEACLPSPVRTSAWEKTCIFKVWFTFVDPFLGFSWSMVNIPEFYTSSKQQGCSHSCPLLGSDSLFVLCTEHVNYYETTVHGLVVCLLCRTWTPHCCCFVKICQLGLSPRDICF